MALDDYRVLVEVAPNGYVALEVADGAKPIRLELVAEGASVVIALDDFDAGAVFDALAGAIRTVLGRQARAQLEPHDTPTAP